MGTTLVRKAILIALVGIGIQASANNVGNIIDGLSGNMNPYAECIKIKGTVAPGGILNGAEGVADAIRTFLHCLATVRQTIYQRKADLEAIRQRDRIETVLQLAGGASGSDMYEFREWVNDMREIERSIDCLNHEVGMWRSERLHLSRRCMGRRSDYGYNVSTLEEAMKQVAKSTREYQEEQFRELEQLNLPIDAEAIELNQGVVESERKATVLMDAAATAGSNHREAIRAQWKSDTHGKQWLYGKTVPEILNAMAEIQKSSEQYLGAILVAVEAMHKTTIDVQRLQTNRLETDRVILAHRERLNDGRARRSRATQPIIHRGQRLAPTPPLGERLNGDNS